MKEVKGGRKQNYQGTYQPVLQKKNYSHKEKGGLLICDICLGLNTNWKDLRD